LKKIEKLLILSDRRKQKKMSQKLDTAIAAENLGEIGIF